METKIKKQQELSLYEVLQIAGSDGCDICDDDYDWGVYLGFQESWEKCTDFYDKCMLLFALNLKCSGYHPDRYSSCDVAKFIWRNREPFERFMNEENRTEYRPRYWQKKGETIDPDEDGVFYDVYMTTFESLIVGNYSEHDYQKLFKYLTEWSYWQNINTGNFKETKAFVDTCLSDIEIQTEDGDEYLITRYNFSEDPQSMMNLGNLNLLYDGIFKKEDYIVVKVEMWKYYNGEGECEVDADIVTAAVTSDTDDISLSCVLKPKGLLKSIFNNHKVIDYLQSVESNFGLLLNKFKVKED